uniref:DCD domain-containing protein n=1 Tax=Rhizophora mucronata TaxID=61149 RepID=A0A2P2JWR9_RHIMU
MENMHSFWQLGDELRGHSKVSEDHKWLMAASKLAEQTRSKGERMNNLDVKKGTLEVRPRDKTGIQEDNKFESLNFNMLNLDSKITENMSKDSFRNAAYNLNAMYQKNNINSFGNLTGSKYNGNIQNSKEPNNNSTNTNNNNDNNNANNAVDKRFKTLPATETLPRNEVLGGYIFVCNNDTMQEDLKRQLFGICFFLLSPYLLPLSSFC